MTLTGEVNELREEEEEKEEDESCPVQLYHRQRRGKEALKVNQQLKQ